MKPSRGFVTFVAGTLLIADFESHPFDQPHLHSDVNVGSNCIDVSSVSASGNNNATAWVGSHTFLPRMYGK
jgi:hypothetical protein